MQDNVDDQWVSSQADDADDDINERDEDSCHACSCLVPRICPISAVRRIEEASIIENTLVKEETRNGAVAP